MNVACYADKPETIDALKGNIHEAIGEIQLHRIDNVLKLKIEPIHSMFYDLFLKIALSAAKLMSELRFDTVRLLVVGCRQR